ncbi:malate dehydrogenase-like isoform X2 [Diabrotica undecimpunctata]|uniref:malate dehydrogenase-like isoform X2 n=1 Tax=Diabrotica undecimpunctata TaxID=50387 RepID=UPI003B6331EA
MSSKMNFLGNFKMREPCNQKLLQKKLDCPIYIHEYRHCVDPNLSDNRIEKYSKMFNQNSKRMLNKIEETYWATWKPSNYKTKETKNKARKPENDCINKGTSVLKKQREIENNNSIGDVAQELIEYVNKPTNVAEPIAAKTLFKKSLSVTKFTIRKCSTTVPPPKEPIVTVLNAASEVGQSLAFLLKQNFYIGELRLYDKNKLICNIAEDLSHIDTKTKIRSFVGVNVLRQAVTGADIVVTVGGDKVSTKETFEEIFNRNVNDVRITALHLTEFNPKGIFCVARPPVEALVPLVSEEFKKAGVYDWKKIFGVTTIASMRSNSIIAAKTKHKPLDMVCPIAGGLSNECFVPVISQVRPKIAINGRDIRQKILNSEHDILKLYCEEKVVCLTPALAISRFINTLLKTLKGQTNCAECAFVRQMGHIGNFLPYMTSIVRLSRHGILSSHMPNVDGEESVLLQQMAIRIKQYIKYGESFVTGEPQTVKEKLPKPKDFQIKTYAQKSTTPETVNAS